MKLRLLCGQVLQELLGQGMDYEKVQKLTADARFGEYHTDPRTLGNSGYSAWDLVQRPPFPAAHPDPPASAEESEEKTLTVYPQSPLPAVAMLMAQGAWGL